MAVENQHEKEVLALEKKIEKLKKRMPAHSIPIEMMQELEDLEDELSAKKTRYKRKRLNEVDFE